MANYYHEARAQCKNLKKLQDDNRRRAERRAELANARQDLPIQSVQVDGRQCPVHRSTEQYNDIERLAGMVAWNGDQECLIDRFDARSMLDFYSDYTPPAVDNKTNDEREIEERVAFESFRDLVKLVRTGLTDEAGLAYVENEALDIRVEARSRAAAAAGVSISKEVPVATAPGEGMYSNAVFSFPDEQEVEGLDDYEDEEPADTAEDDMIQAAEEDETALDEMAATCGITHFTAQLQRAVVQEEEELDSQFRKRRRISRRKMAERVRRMIGQGLNPFGKSKAWWKDSVRWDVGKARDSRSSPDYGGPQNGSRRQRDRDTSPASSRPQAITEFSAARPVSASSSDDEDPVHLHDASNHRGSGSLMHEALPGMVDPAINGGPVALPAAGSKMYGKKDYTYADRVAERQKQQDRMKISMNRATATASVAGKKETPQERMKRMIAAQFNSNVAKDTRTLLEKKALEVRDSQARATIERHAKSMPKAPRDRLNRDFDRRSPSPPPRERPSRTPSRHRRSTSYSPRRSRSRRRSSTPPSRSRRHTPPPSHRSHNRRRSDSRSPVQGRSDSRSPVHDRPTNRSRGEPGKFRRRDSPEQALRPRSYR